VTISNSFSDSGILAVALEPLPDLRLTVTITGNQLLANGAGADPGIYVSEVGGKVTGNFIRPRRGGMDYVGIIDAAPNVTVSGNTIAGDDLGDGSGITAGLGIAIGADGATVKSNKITGLQLGINLNCDSATVTGNTIVGATIGLLDAPASFAGSNSFFSTQQNVAGSCP
jgi:nitrous oxidase accessory protein NosD